MGSTYRIHACIISITRLVIPVILTLVCFPMVVSGEETEGELVVQGTDTVYHLTHNDVKSGERLFYGLMREQEGQAACISCHNIHPTDTLNWNPTAWDIAVVSHSKTFADLKSALLSPGGKVLSRAHAGYQSLTDDQLAQIKVFLNTYYNEGGYQRPPVINRLLYFVGLVVLFLLALLDLIWFRKIPFRVVHVLALLVTAAFITKEIAHESIAIGRSKNYMPDQPIKFSHQVHAGQNKIDCLYCHSSAEYSKSAGIPSASVCLNCHMVVREGSRSGRFEIEKIFAAIDSNKPVQWIRVYSLPDHAFFSHAQHVGAGKLACQTCHGAVETMDRISQVPDLSMGWCINCHRDTRVQFHENAFYAKYDSLQQKIDKGEIDSVTVEMIGGTDCMKCHY
jgi:hypothetical protein